MTSFEFATAGRILFGCGSLASALDQIAAWGKRPLVVTGRSPQRHQDILHRLEACGATCHIFPVAGEPTISVVEEGLARARAAGCDMVLGIGGGSVIDAGKALAALLTNDGPLTDYLEVIGPGRPLAQNPAPFVAVPTTAGTGAEATRNAVLASPADRVKVSMRSPLMLPRLAVVDPELTLSLPPDITAATGMDALTQLVEAFVSRKANPFTDGLCREGIKRCARSLPTACRDGANLEARTDMALASLFSGIALANGGLGAVHGIAGPLGGRVDIPHGFACGRLLPPVYALNAEKMQTGPQNSPGRSRFVEIARILTGSDKAGIADGAAWIEDLARALGIPPLARFGVTAADLPAIAAAAQNASSMQGNPVALTPAELISVLKQALEP